MAQSIGLNRKRQVPAEDTPGFGAIAERFRRAGDLERAVALCLEGLAKFPNIVSARVTLGWALLDLGRYDEAREALETALKRAPDNLAAIRGLAELHDRAEHTMTVPLDGHADGLEVDAAADTDMPVPAEPLSLDSVLAGAKPKGKTKGKKGNQSVDDAADIVMTPAAESGGIPDLIQSTSHRGHQPTQASAPEATTAAATAADEAADVDLNALLSEIAQVDSTVATTEDAGVDLIADSDDADIEKALQMAQAAAEQAAADAAATRKVAEEQSAAEAAARKAAEDRAAAETAARRVAEEKAAAEVAARKAAEEKAAAEAAARKAAEEKAAEAAAKQAAEQKAASERAAKQAAEERSAAQAAAEAAEKKAAEERAAAKAAADAAAKKAAEERAAAKAAAEAAAKKAAEEKAAAEAAAKKAAEERAAEAKARQAAEEKAVAEMAARKAAEEKAAAETAARKAAEEKAAEATRKAAEDRAAAEAAARKAAEERAAAEAAARRAADEKAEAEAAAQLAAKTAAAEAEARKRAEERAATEAARAAEELAAARARPQIEIHVNGTNAVNGTAAHHAAEAAQPGSILNLSSPVPVSARTGSPRRALPELESLLRRVESRRTQLMTESVA